jgi:photosystem II stability/assembly factor-like uncharacterized protein
VFQGPLELPALKSELAIRAPLNAFAMAGSRMVVAGQRGHILHSGDGKNWVQADVPLSADLNALHFPTRQLGWAVGQEGAVLHSADAGATWQRQLDGRQIGTLVTRQTGQAADAGTDKPLLDVWFEDDKKGWAVGAFNLILRTEDGGKTWTPWMDRTDNPKGMHLYAIRPAGGTVFIVGEQGLVLRLDRQKQRFASVTLPYQGTLFGVIGNEKTTLVFGLRGNAYRSTDGGASWTKVETHVAAGLGSGVVRADGSMLLVSQAGHVLLSNDEGATFRPVKVGVSAPTFAVAETADGAVALAGIGGVRIEAVK